MKYIRTKNGIYEFVDFRKTEGMRCANHYGYRRKDGLCILGELKDWKEERKADTIEELCDEFVVEDRDEFAIFHNLKLAKQTKGIIYGAIWTDKGLIYVAKMNEKGELELL